jgi:hypothetical protein
VAIDGYRAQKKPKLNCCRKSVLNAKARIGIRSLGGGRRGGDKMSSSSWNSDDDGGGREKVRKIIMFWDKDLKVADLEDRVKTAS